MSYTPRPNTGNLFIAKKTVESSPDFTGTLFVERGLLKSLMEKHSTPDGLVQISIACWNAKSKNTGQSYLSLRASEPLAPKPKKVEDVSQEPADDEDVPF